jgi:hypothetical protein
MDKTVTILIPTRFDSRYMIELCLESVKRHTQYPYKVIVGDAGVNEETRRFLESRNDIKLVKAENPSLPKDSLIKYVETPYFLILHDDAQVMVDGWLERRVKILENRQNIGIVGPVVANFVYGWKRRFLYKRSMRRFWPLALLVKTDVQRELSLRWGVIRKDDNDSYKYLKYFGHRSSYDTGGMAYQQFVCDGRYKYVKCKFHKEIKHFGGMTWPVKKKVQNEKAGFNIDIAVDNRNKKLQHIKALLDSGLY